MPVKSNAMTETPLPTTDAPPLVLSKLDGSAPLSVLAAFLFAVTEGSSAARDATMETLKVVTAALPLVPSSLVTLAPLEFRVNLFAEIN